MNLLQFLVDTWETTYESGSKADLPSDNSGKKRGPPLHARSKYLPGHPKSGTRQRVLRASDHHTLPNIVGPFIPRNDDPDTYNYYCAFMLTLLKPWRDLRGIQVAGQSWAVAFGTFMLSASARHQDIISSAQYYYQCRDAASKERDTANAPPIINDADMEFLDLPEEQNPVVIPLPPPTEAELEEFEYQKLPHREIEHGSNAIAIARSQGLFSTNTFNNWELNHRPIRKATRADAAQISRWRQAMTVDGAAQRSRGDEAALQPGYEVPAACSVISTAALSLSQSSEDARVEAEPMVADIIDPVDTSLLKEDQLRAFEIVKRHLTQKLLGRQPDQLLMQILGEGGTGKSMAIRCITELFTHRNSQRMLVKGAYTGIAASLIDGSTLHSLCHISIRSKDDDGLNLSTKTLETLRRTWGPVHYLIIDEISMVSREFFARLSSVLASTKQPNVLPANAEPFGGINVILAGDFHQFPPVACGPTAPLYWPDDPTVDRKAARSGRKHFEKFKHVVILKEQCRVTDPVWLDLLRHVRHGMCKSEHIELLQSLVIDRKGTFASEQPGWEDAVLVTPRHAVRIAWNECANRRHCTRTGNQLFISRAEDTIHSRPVTIQERWNAACKKTKNKSNRVCQTKAGLPNKVEVAIGMEVMVTVNVETELDVANGARGVVVDIILDPREDSDTTGAEVKLQYPPACVLVKLHKTKAKQLEGLEDRVLPIVPMEAKYDLPQLDNKTKRVTRRQLPITSAYAFTDYRSQGQTIKKVIVDIGRPPSGALTPFNVYVALSRSSGRDTIRLLRDFDEDLFKVVPCENLEAEDRRLYNLDHDTKQEFEDGLFT